MSCFSSLLFAYIDPGTGAMVLQVILAAILGSAIAFRRIFSAPLNWLRGKNAKPTINESDDDTTPDYHRAA